MSIVDFNITYWTGAIRNLCCLNTIGTRRTIIMGTVVVSTGSLTLMIHFILPLASNLYAPSPITLTLNIAVIRPWTPYGPSTCKFVVLTQPRSTNIEAGKVELVNQKLVLQMI